MCSECELSLPVVCGVVFVEKIFGPIDNFCFYFKLVS